MNDKLHVDKNGKRVLNPAKQWLPKSNFFYEHMA